MRQSGRSAVREEDSSTTSRLVVEGGWLHRVAGKEAVGGLAFVPGQMVEATGAADETDTTENMPRPSD